MKASSSSSSYMAVVLTSLVLSACGGGDGAGNSVSTTAALPASNGTLAAADTGGAAEAAVLADAPIQASAPDDSHSLIAADIVADKLAAETGVLEAAMADVQPADPMAGEMPAPSAIRASFALAAAAPLSPASPTVAANCVPSTTGGTTYNVGTGAGMLAKIGDVNWNNLKAGDVVRIHWRATPYAEKILISTIATAAKPLRVCGVPGGPNAGDKFMPVITGANATTRADLKFGSLQPDGVSVLEPLGLVTIHNSVYELKPANIIIEGLHLTGANQFTKFTAANGKVKNHGGFTACIRLQKGDKVTIRGNEISDCGNGVFALSRDGENQTSRDLLLERNYVHGNGAVAGPTLNGMSPESVHAMYIQTLGMVAQFNYFGPNRAGAPGGVFKDRSVGSIIRYNWFSQGARILDFVEPQDYDTSIFPAAWDAYVAAYGTKDMPTRAQVVAAFAKYQKTYVYGNFIRNVVIKGKQGAYAPVHFGGDQGQPGIGRQGKLYFFNNTVVTFADYADASRLSVFDMGLGSSFTKASKIEAFNNIIHLQSRHAGTPRPEYFLTRHNFENINLGKNWINSDYQLQGPDLEDYQIDLGLNNSGIINGVGNLVTGDVNPVGTVTLRPKAGGTVLGNAGQALPAELASFPVSFQFQVNQTSPMLSKSVARSSPTDLGAVSIAP
ncbi:MAG: hypothetical protein V4772_14260 [Pseudomonadota bacterium]